MAPGAAPVSPSLPYTKFSPQLFIIARVGGDNAVATKRRTQFTLSPMAPSSPQPSRVTPPHEAEDPVWNLLTHSRKVNVSPQFTDQVLRAVRHLGTRPTRWTSLVAWIRSPRCAWAAAFLLLVGGVWWVNLDPATPGTAQSSIEQPLTPVGLNTSSPDLLGEQILTELAMLDEATALLAPSSAQELGEDDIAMILF